MVFPLYDENPFAKPAPPYVTWALIAANVLVYLATVGAPEEAYRAFNASFGAVPAVIMRDVAAGPLPPEATLFTSLFLHGGWEHLLGNMVYLWVFGDDIEEALGRLRYLAFFLLGGALAALVFVLFHAQSRVPLVGASGAISGVLAAYLMIRPCAKVSIFVVRVVLRVRAFWVIGGWVIWQIFLGATAGAEDHVAYTAHFGGFAAGAILLLCLRPAGLHLFQCIGEADTWRSVFGR
jgi:membrane associated rhomboid family serine protease